jgi:hypothetical protein
MGRGGVAGHDGAGVDSIAGGHTRVSPAVLSSAAMKVGVSLPDELLSFADAEARRRGTTRSGLLAELLEAERVRQQLRSYLDRHGWDVAEDDSAWQEYQRRRMAEEYGDDDW